MPGKYVIWDFNGTVLDDVQTGIDSINVLLGRRGLPRIASADEYRSRFRFPIIEYYRGLGFDFEKEPFSQVAVEWVEQYDLFVRDAVICDGVREAAARLASAGFRQVLLSATEQNMLERQLRELGIDGLFSEAMGMDNIEAHTKLPAALGFMRRTAPDTAIMIGDTTHDAEVASKIGAVCLLVASGHQNRRTLMSCGVPVFDTISEAADHIIKTF